MFLAFAEMRRAKLRFSLLIAAVSLLVFLILAQQALQNSLVTGFIGALRQQSAPVLVYTTDAQRSPQGSVIPPDLAADVADVEGIAERGRIGIGSFPITGDLGDTTATVFSAEGLANGRVNLGAPQTLSTGRYPSSASEAIGSAADFAVGQRVEVAPSGSATPVPLTVVGLAEDAQLFLTPTLYADYAAYEAGVRAVNPAARTVLPSAIAVIPAAGVSEAELITRINATSDDLEALTRTQAADLAPGVAQVRQSFQIIFALYGLVVPLVTGLFFLIITFQKAGALTLLRAIGAQGGVLVRSLLVQVLVVIGGGIILGTLLYTPLSQISLGGLALRFEWSAVAFWSALLLSLGLLSALVAARRVLAIDPIQATTGGLER